LPYNLNNIDIKRKRKYDIWKSTTRVYLEVLSRSSHVVSCGFYYLMRRLYISTKLNSDISLMKVARADRCFFFSPVHYLKAVLSDLLESEKQVKFDFYIITSLMGQMQSTVIKQHYLVK
jgi:hypothetical protein